jgi:hypothetical protein
MKNWRSSYLEKFASVAKIVADPSTKFELESSGGCSVKPEGKTSDIKIRPIGSGKYSDVYIVSWKDSKMAMRVSYYRDDTVKKFAALREQGKIEEAKAVRNSDAVSVGSSFSKYARILSETVSPHFVMMYCDENVKSFVTRFPLISDKRRSELSEYQKVYNNICFMEAFSSDLTKYLLNSKDYDDDVIRTIIFQVLYTVAALQEKIPGWRHNDLSTNNILVQNLKKPLRARYEMSPSNEAYYVKCPVLVGLNDWDFVHAPDSEFENSRVTCGKYRVDGNPNNKSYDVHFFLKWMLRCVGKKLQADFPETTEFLKRIGLRDHDRQDTNIPMLSPLRVLQDRYFDKLKTPRKYDVSYGF